MEINNKNRIFLEKICRILGFINQIIPKKKKILIYNSTPTYQNNYAMFRYLVEQEYNNDYKIYYYMPKSNEYIEKSKNITLKYSLIGSLYHYLTSKYVFLDTGNMRIRPSKSQKVINLWHGVPFKRIGFMSKSVEKNLPRDLMNTFSKIIVTSENMKKIYIKSFLLKDSQIFFSGQPRNDLLWKNTDSFKKIGIKKEKYTKTLVWMTTYRISKDRRLLHTSNEEWSQTGLPLLINDKEMEELNNILYKYNILLIIKHHTTGKESEVKIKNTENIKVLEEKDYLDKRVQLYEILGECDALITDYSSVFIDYLLLNKPIGFIISDIEDYNKNNGFSLENPIDYMPGIKISTLNDLKIFIKKLAFNEDEYGSKRKEVSKYFNKYETKENCKNILEEVGILRSK